MIRDTIRFALCFFVFYNDVCDGQFVNLKKKRDNYVTTMSPLPFPPCRADNIDCLRRGLRTFFFLMDAGYMGMMSVDPMIINSVAVSLPEQELSILMRRVNVTGAMWTRLMDRKFHLVDDKSGVTFKTDLHITGEITVSMVSARNDPITAFITIDTQDTESNITYAMTGRQGIDNEDYIFIDRERIAVRNTRAPTFFVQPKNEETLLIEQLLNLKPSILEHLTNEMTVTLMHSIIDNFRLFARKTPVKYYYEYVN